MKDTIQGEVVVEAEAVEVVVAAVAVVEGVVVAGGVADVEANYKMKVENIPFLGIGLSYRSNFSAEVFMNRDKISFLEIVADHFIDAPLEKLKELDLLRKNFVLIPHAINLSLGSTGKIDQNYLSKLALLIERIDPPYWSEHISYSKAGEIEIGHLSPLPFTNSSVDALSRNIECVSKKISRPLILENISYLVKIPSMEMEEVEFLNKIFERTDCGLLLDVTNLYFNSKNHNYDPLVFLNSLKKDKIVQLHFTGGIQQDGIYIDNHSSPTSQEVWNLLKSICNISKVKGAVLERDDAHPEFQEILNDLELANTIFLGDNGVR